MGYAIIDYGVPSSFANIADHHQEPLGRHERLAAPLRNILVVSNDLLTTTICKEEDRENQFVRRERGVFTLFMDNALHYFVLVRSY
jgi:hypothetical protein